VADLSQKKASFTRRYIAAVESFLSISDQLADGQDQEDQQKGNVRRGHGLALLSKQPGGGSLPLRGHYIESTPE